MRLGLRRLWVRKKSIDWSHVVHDMGQKMTTQSNLLRGALCVISGVEIHKGSVGVDPGVVVALTLRHKHPAPPSMSPRCVVF